MHGGYSCLSFISTQLALLSSVDVGSRGRSGLYSAPAENRHYRVHLKPPLMPRGTRSATSLILQPNPATTAPRDCHRQGGSPTSLHFNAKFFSWFSGTGKNKSTKPLSSARDSDDDGGEKKERVRIAIIGGSIAGMTAASSLVKYLWSTESVLSKTKSFEIEVWEGDPHGGLGSWDGGEGGDDDMLCAEHPKWRAAAAKNGNSIVPAASMHVFSRKGVLWEVLRDTVKEEYHILRDRFFPSSRSEDFAVPPPYFALHLVRCLGPSASSDERWSFVRFASNFLYYTVWLGEAEADDRSRKLLQLARANRASYLSFVGDVVAGGGGAKAREEERNRMLRQKMGHSTGLLSVHRTVEQAKAAVEEAHDYGENAHMLDGWEEAVEYEPHFANIPIPSNTLHVVRRPNDYTASCEIFVRESIRRANARGVQYRAGKVRKLQALASSGIEESNEKNTGIDKKSKRRFLVTMADGSEHEYDLVVLAAGPMTSLLAEQLSVGKFCPVYPLRGYSLTIFAQADELASRQETDPRAKTGRSDGVKTDPRGNQRNLLHQPFSLDSMYCSSVSPCMARFAGFGEFVGYAHKAYDVPSVAPAVMTRYAKAIFPEAADHIKEEDAKQCFRATSPDDLPIAGEVPKLPGLFLHTGHGTLGWTMSLATADCLAQAVVDRLEGRDTQNGTYELADQTAIDRTYLSPARFAR